MRRHTSSSKPSVDPRSMLGGSSTSILESFKSISYTSVRVLITHTCTYFGSYKLELIPGIQIYIVSGVDTDHPE